MRVAARLHGHFESAGAVRRLSTRAAAADQLEPVGDQVSSRISLGANSPKSGSVGLLDGAQMMQSLATCQRGAILRFTGEFETA